MAHESPEILKMRLAAAEDLVALHSLQRHYKGGVYRVNGYAIQETTDLPVIRYSPVDDSGLEYFKPLSDWLEPAEINGEPVPRFEPIEGAAATTLDGPQGPYSA